MTILHCRDIIIEPFHIKSCASSWQARKGLPGTASHLLGESPPIAQGILCNLQHQVTHRMT